MIIRHIAAILIAATAVPASAQVQSFYQQHLAQMRAQAEARRAEVMSRPAPMNNPYLPPMPITPPLGTTNCQPVYLSQANGIGQWVQACR